MIEGLPANLVPVTRQAAVSVDSIETMLSTLEQQAVLELSGDRIRARQQAACRLPKTIRRLKREVVMTERRLKEYTDHALIDDQWCRLMDERRLALRMLAHDAEGSEDRAEARWRRRQREGESGSEGRWVRQRV